MQINQRSKGRACRRTKYQRAKRHKGVGTEETMDHNRHTEPTVRTSLLIYFVWNEMALGPFDRKKDPKEPLMTAPDPSLNREQRVSGSGFICAWPCLPQLRTKKLSSLAARNQATRLVVETLGSLRGLRASS